MPHTPLAFVSLPSLLLCFSCRLRSACCPKIFSYYYLRHVVVAVRVVVVRVVVAAAVGTAQFGGRARMCNKGRGCGRAAEHSVAGAPTIKKKTKETKTKNAALTLTQRSAVDAGSGAGQGSRAGESKRCFHPPFS